MGDRPYRYWALIAVLVLLVAGVFLFQTGLIYGVLPPPDDYERVTAAAVDANGTELSTVDARVADTDRKRYVGLSATDSLARNEGMLFVHGSEGEQRYVMRDMAFPLDIVFVAENGTVTAIRHAPVPDGSADRSYGGRAKWVLEVERGWANRTGLDEGDRVEIPPELDGE